MKLIISNLDCMVMSLLKFTTETPTMHATDHVYSSIICNIIKLLSQHSNYYCSTEQIHV